MVQTYAFTVLYMLDLILACTYVVYAKVVVVIETAIGLVDISVQVCKQTSGLLTGESTAVVGPLLSLVMMLATKIR